MKLKLNKSDLRVWVIDEHMAAVLRIATSTFTPKTQKIVNVSSANSPPPSKKLIDAKLLKILPELYRTQVSLLC
jgi:hypothetical protein